MLTCKGGFKSQVTLVAGCVVWNKHIITCNFLLQFAQNADDTTGLTLHHPRNRKIAFGSNLLKQPQHGPYCALVR